MARFARGVRACSHSDPLRPSLRPDAFSDPPGQRDTWTSPSLAPLGRSARPTVIPT